jgi:CBS domain-containing protein
LPAFFTSTFLKGKTMLIRDLMTRGVRTLSPSDSVLFAAQAMAELDVGSIPVCDGQRLVGVVTDRDLTIRSLAQGRDPGQTQLEQVMSADVQWCYEEQSVEEAAQLMRDAQIRRLPIVDHDRKLVGVVSLGDLASKGGEDEASAALRDISTPSEPDRSGQSAASGSAGGGSASGQPRTSLE